MSDCHEIQDKLFDLISGKISDEEARRVRAHLKTCKTCQSEYEKLNWIHQHVKNHIDELSAVNVEQEPCPNPELLIDFSEGNLSPDGTKRIERHLQTCPACKKAVEALTEIGKGEEGTIPVEPDEIEPPPQFIRAVHAAYPRSSATRDEKEKKPFWKLLWAGLGTLAVGTAVVILVLGHVARKGKVLFLPGGIVSETPVHVYGVQEKRLGFLILVDPNLRLSETTKREIQRIANQRLTHLKDYHLISPDVIRKILNGKKTGKSKEAVSTLVRSGEADAWLFLKIKRNKKKILVEAWRIGANGSKVKEANREVLSEKNLLESVEAVLSEVI